MSEVSKFSLRLPKSLNTELKELADQDNRSLNNYIITVLENHVSNIKWKQADIERGKSSNYSNPRD